MNDRAQGLDPQLVHRASGGQPIVPADDAGTQGNVLRLDGEYWTVAYCGREIRIRDSKGMDRLAALLRAPGREFHALDLVGAGVLVGAGDAGPKLDQEAKSAYRRRLADLDAEIDEAENGYDLARAEKALAEREFLVAELTAAVGLGGRDRAAASAAERARQNVTRAVRGAIRRIAACHPALGSHLETTVRTGMYCVYQPDARVPICWMQSPACDLPTEAHSGRS